MDVFLDVDGYNVDPIRLHLVCVMAFLTFLQARVHKQCIPQYQLGHADRMKACIWRAFIDSIIIWSFMMGAIKFKKSAIWHKLCLAQELDWVLQQSVQGKLSTIGCSYLGVSVNDVVRHARATAKEIALQGHATGFNWSLLWSVSPRKLVRKR